MLCLNKKQAATSGLRIHSIEIRIISEFFLAPFYVIILEVVILLRNRIEKAQKTQFSKEKGYVF